MEIDWYQAQLNEWSYCFCVEDNGDFCGRAEWWPGHAEDIEHGHPFESFAQFLDNKRADNRWIDSKLVAKCERLEKRNAELEDMMNIDKEHERIMSASEEELDRILIDQGLDPEQVVSETTEMFARLIRESEERPDGWEALMKARVDADNLKFYHEEVFPALPGWNPKVTPPLTFFEGLYKYINALEEICFHSRNIDAFCDDIDGVHSRVVVKSKYIKRLRDALADFDAVCAERSEGG